MIPGDPLSFSTLILLGLAVLVVGAIPGSLVLRLVRGPSPDQVEDTTASFAAPGIGLILFGALAGLVVWILGRYSPVLIAFVWITLCVSLFALVRRFSPPRKLALRWPALVFVGLAVVVFWPVSDFPVSPDYDGTADGYLATIISLDQSYPRFRPFGDEFLKVTIPPAAVVTGAFFSDISGVFPGRVQLGLAGTAGIFYLMALPWAGWPILRRFATWPWLAILPGLLGYQWVFKVIYYDGSNLRLYGALGLVVAIGFWLRASEGNRRAAAMAGIAAGAILYFHHRFFILAAISGAAHVAFESVRATFTKDEARKESRACLADAAVVAACAIVVVIPFLVSTLSQISATSSHALWTQSRMPGLPEYVNYAERLQGRFAFFGTPIAGLLVLFWGHKFPAARLLAAACLGQSLFMFDGLTRTLLPMLASYMDRVDLVSSGFLESRPILFAAGLAFFADRVTTTAARWRRVANTFVVSLAVIQAVVTFGRPMPFCYTYLSRGDYAALSWIRNNTPRENTVVLAYAFDDISDEEMGKVWPVPSPRLSFNAETFWVAPVSNRRTVFHWVNRHTHQKIWSILAGSSPTLPAALSSLNEAYMKPDLPESAAVMKRHGITHLFYPFYMHLSFRPALERSPHLRRVFLAPPPVDIGYGRDSAPRDTSPLNAPAVYELVDNTIATAGHTLPKF